MLIATKIVIASRIPPRPCRRGSPTSEEDKSKIAVARLAFGSEVIQNRFEDLQKRAQDLQNRAQDLQKRAQELQKRAHELQKRAHDLQK